MRQDIVTRIKLLDEVLRDISFIRTEIAYRCTSLPEILECAESALFRRCISNLNSGFSYAWNTSVGKCSVLNAQEKNALLILSGLGTTEAAGQLKLLDSAEKSIEDASQKASKELSEKGRMLLSCSVLCGAMAAIIIY